MSGTRIRLKLGGSKGQGKGTPPAETETAKSTAQEDGRNAGGNAETAATTATSQSNITNDILGMVSPGASHKLPSFKKTAKLKVKQPVEAASSSVAGSSSSNSNANRPVKSKKAKGSAAANAAAPTIDWTSSSGDNDEADAETAPKQSVLSNGKGIQPKNPSATQKGKGKAKQTSADLPVTTHEDGSNSPGNGHSTDRTPLASTLTSRAGSATPSASASQSQFAAGPSETTVFVLRDPPSRPPSPSEDEDENVQDTMFDLEAQIQSAMQGGTNNDSNTSAAQAQGTAQIDNSTSNTAPTQPSIQESDDDDDDDDQPFDFNAHIAAALGSTAPATSDTTIQDPNQTSFDPSLLSLGQSTSFPTFSSSIDPPKPLATSNNSNSNDMPIDLPNASQADKDPDDDSESGDDGEDLTFNLNAMLASAMAQATAEVSAPSPSSSSAFKLGSTSADNTSFVSMPEKSLSGGAATASGFSKPPPVNNGFNMEHDSEDDDDDDDEEEDMFDLDAQLQAAMAGQQEHHDHQERDSDFSDEGDEEFDLDAEIGAAMGGVIDHTKEAAAAGKASSQGMGSEGGVTADDLQAMLKNAMHQAAMELQADEGEDTAVDTSLPGQTLEKSTKGRPFIIPPKPRYKPSVQDDGDPDNAFNRARPSHFQALPFAYSCSFQMCDKIFARPENLRAHQMTHFNKLPFQCPHCPLAFLTNDEMRIHFRTHDITRAWRYRCKGCHNLFGDKELFDKHASSAGEESKCRKGECEFEIRPPAPKFRRPPKSKPVHGTRSGYEDINIDPSLAALDDSAPPSAQGTPVPDAEAVPPPAPEPYFRTTHFNASRLLASTLVSQMASLLAQQYDRQNSLLGADDPRIDVNRALGQTIRGAGLTLRETAALATVLAEVASSRNTNLKISLDIARDVQADIIEKQSSFQPYYNQGPMRGKQRKPPISEADKKARAAEAEMLKKSHDEEQIEARRKYAHIASRGPNPKPSKKSRDKDFFSPGMDPWADIPVPVMDENAR